MGLVLHGSATMTAAVRRAIQYRHRQIGSISRSLQGASNGSVPGAQSDLLDGAGEVAADSDFAEASIPLANLNRAMRETGA